MKRSELIRSLLRSVGEDPDRDGLQRTPERVDRSFDEIRADMNNIRASSPEDLRFLPTLN